MKELWRRFLKQVVLNHIPLRTNSKLLAKEEAKQYAAYERGVVDGGAGVIYLYGNYSGDVINFDMAAEEAATLGIECRSVAVADDIASAPKGREGERRGIAGDFFVFKIAGAAAEVGAGVADGVSDV